MQAWYAWRPGDERCGRWWCEEEENAAGASVLPPRASGCGQPGEPGRGRGQPGLGSDGGQVPGLQPGGEHGDVPRDQGRHPQVHEVSWYNDTPLDASLEMNPAAWPPGSWEHHRLDGSDDDAHGGEEPNPQVPVETTSQLDSSLASNQTKHRKIPSTYPPSFSATPSESYLEWKRSVQCWIAGEGGQLPEDVMGPRCLSVLKGRASVIVRHLKIDEVSKPGGLEKVFQALEASPMIKELDGQRGEKAQREFLRCRRHAGESMESFIMRVQAQRAVMEEEDSNFCVGDRFLVGYILDHAELTLKDRVMVLAAAQNQMSSEHVFPALRRMGPFLQGTIPIGKGVIDSPLLPELQPDYGASSGKATEKEAVRKGWQNYKAHVAVEDGGYSGDEQEGTADVAGADELIPEELEAATHAALAAYSTSQAKLKAIKQARGYFRRTEPTSQPDRKDRLKKLMQENPCRGCGAYGHWSKDPECPKNAKGAPAMASTSSSTCSPAQVSPDAVAEHAAMSAVLEQIMKDQRQASRVYMAAVCSSSCGDEKSKEFTTLVNNTDELLTSRMVVDLGCLRTVAGTKWVLAEIKRCQQQGRYFEVRPTMDYFRFGDGERRPSRFRVFMEVGFHGHVGLLAINAVEYPCPPLLSKGVCFALGLHLDCGSGRYDLTKLGVRSQQFDSSVEGHYVIAIDEFHPSWPTWLQLREQGHVPKIQHPEVQMFELRQGAPVGKGVRRMRVSSQGCSKKNLSESAPALHSIGDDVRGAAPSAQREDCSGGGGTGGFISGGGSVAHQHRDGGGVRCASMADRGRSGRVDVTGPLNQSAKDSQGDPSRRVHAECSAGTSLDRKCQTTTKEQGQDFNQDFVQKGPDGGPDWTSSRLSDLGHDSEPRCGLQYVLDPPWPPDGAQVEAVGVAPESSIGHGKVEHPVEEASTLVGNDVQSRSGIHLGASGNSKSHIGRAQGTAADALNYEQSSERAVFVSKVKPWSRGQVQQLKQAAKKVQEVVHSLSLVARNSNEPTWKVLEIFGGSAALSLMAKSTGKWVALEPVDLVYGSDLLSPKEQQLVLEQIDLWEPDLVCLEPPCGPWSGLQALNHPEVVDMKRAIHMPFWTFSAKVWKRQNRAGRLVLLEQPLLSAALKLPCMLERSDVHRAVVDQCRFGLKDPLSSLLFRKRTALDVNSDVFAAALMKNALCNHQPHEHQPIEGQTMVDGQWVNRSLVAGTWTPHFGKHILACAALALSQGACWKQQVNGVCSYVADFEEQVDPVANVFLSVPYQHTVCQGEGCYSLCEAWCSMCKSGWCAVCSPKHPCAEKEEVERVGEALALVSAIEDGDDAWLDHGVVPEELKTEVAISKTFKQLQRIEDERKGDYSGVGSRYGYVSFGGASLRVTKAIRTQVAKLHGTLGHPSNDRLARMLSLQGAKKEVIQAAKDLKCEICRRIHPPVSAPKSSASGPERFNGHVSSDSFFILDADGQRWNVTHLVDGFCALQTAILSKNPSSQTSVDLLFDRWIIVYGPMKELTVDGGPEFRGKFPALCQLYDVQLHVNPTSAKWKNGLAERHGSILKLLLLKMVQELVLTKESDLRCAVAMAVQAKNRLMRRCGKSPIQVVQGRDDVLPSSLLAQVDRGEVKFASNADILESEEHQAMERMRQEAAAAFHWLDAHERLRMALNSRSRPPHVKADALVPGSVVYFFKQPGQNRRLQDFATGYQGPAVVACADGPDKVWLRFKGSVVRVAIENVRLATPEEEVGTSFIMDAMKELEQELTAGRRPPGYEDEEDDVPQEACGSSLPSGDIIGQPWSASGCEKKEEPGVQAEPVTESERKMQETPKKCRGCQKIDVDNWMVCPLSIAPAHMIHLIFNRFPVRLPSLRKVRKMRIGLLSCKMFKRERGPVRVYKDWQQKKMCRWLKIG